MCTTCGKPCRSVQEQQLHTTRNPGHTAFADKTHEAAKPLDTAAEVQAIRKEEAALLADTPMPDAPAGGGAAASPADAVPDGELISPPVDAALLLSLTEMGFSEARATRALYHTGTDSIEVAVNWLGEHAEDGDIDTPLLVPANKLKKKLSKEEARAAAEALRTSILTKRDKEEKELAKLRELERIRSGKEMLARAFLAFCIF